MAAPPRLALAGSLRAGAAAPRPLVAAAAVAATLITAACGSDVTREDGGAGGDPVDEGAPPACGGRWDRAVVLASGLDASELLVVGHHLVLGGGSGRVVRVDRCDGAVGVIATLGSPARLAHGVDGAVLVTGESPPRLSRLDPGGTSLATVAELPGPGRVALGEDGRLLAVLALPDDTGGDVDGNDDTGLFAIDAASGVVSELRREELWLPGTWTLLGASRAGLYVLNSSFHGGNPGLLLVPLDDAPAGELGGTHGAVDLAVIGDHLVVAGEPEEIGMGSGRMEIALMTLSGAEREVLVADSDDVGYVQDVAADPTIACWSSRGQIRCVEPRPGAPVDTLEGLGEDGWIEDLAVAPDAIYWLHRRDRDGDGSPDDVDLVAVAR